MLEEIANAVRSQNPMTLCPFLLPMVENTAVYIILYLFIQKKITRIVWSQNYGFKITLVAITEKSSIFKTEVYQISIILFVRPDQEKSKYQFSIKNRSEWEVDNKASKTMATCIPF